MILTERLADWLSEHSLSCYYRSHFGIECPGCGTQRSLAFLLKGDLYESFVTYPPLFLFLFLFLFLIVHLIFRFRRGGDYLKYLFIATAAAVILNFTWKIFTSEKVVQEVPETACTQIR